MGLTKLDDLVSKKKSFTPAQILGLNKPKKNITIILDIEEDNNDNDNDNDNDDIKLLPTPPSSTKKKPVNLMQLLSGNKPKSLFVTLKLPSIKKHQYENKITKNINQKSLIVSFKYKSITKNNNYKIHPSTSNHPFFKSIYSKLNSNYQIPKSETKIIIKPKLLKLPKIDKLNFKIKNLSNDEITFLNNKSNIKFLNSLKLKLKINLNLSFTDLDYLLFYSKYNSIKQINDYNKFENFIKTVDIEENLNMKLINERYSYLKFDERFNKFFEINYCNSLKTNNTDLWCNIYKPLNHLQNLQRQYISNDIFNWLTIAFNKLKSVNKLKRKQKLSSSKKNLKEFDSFIVYSDEEDEINNNEFDYSTNVPSLIIEGPIGCGKTTMIHSIINNELNGFVFEFNSNQSRARKDLDFNLKQIGTTSMVKQKKTVILFDDVNLIDETNDDKDFWLGINDLLTYSYRPVILITDDLKYIPNNIVNESTIYKFNKIEQNEIYQYLDLISLSRNLNLDSKILDKLSLNDLRKSIMELQMFSYHFDLSNVGLTNITVVNDDDNNNNNNNNNNNKSSNKFGNKLEQLNDYYNKIELEYYTNQIEKCDVYDDNNDNEKDINKFESDRLSSIEFYSSKYFSNGSRSKMCRYMDANDYKKKHPDNCFYTLSVTKVATDIVSLIRGMAQREYSRVQNHNPRRFDHDPVDIFDDLFICF